MRRDYFEFEGKYYGVGTKVLLHVRFRYPKPCEVVFIGYEDGVYRFMQPNGIMIFVQLTPPSKIVEIIDAVEVQIDNGVHEFKSKRSCPMKWQIENAWIWYIIVMFCGAFCTDRWLIWIFATIYFILWANGIL